MWAMIKRSIQEGSSLVIDGVHLVPSLVDLKPFEDHAYLLSVVISTLDGDRHLERFPVREQRADHRLAQRYRKNFGSILRIQDYILKMTEHSDTPIIENENFDETVASILTVFSNTLREKLNLSSEQLRCTHCSRSGTSQLAPQCVPRCRDPSIRSLIPATGAERTHGDGTGRERRGVREKLRRLDLCPKTGAELHSNARAQMGTRNFALVSARS